MSKIQVSFRIDANGIPSVEAEDLGTGRRTTAFQLAEAMYGTS